MYKDTYKHYFNLDEANSSLHSIRLAVCKIYQMNNLLQSLLKDMRISNAADLSLDTLDHEPNLDNISSIKILLSGITDEMEALKEKGYLFKSIERGIIEWPTIKNNTTVFFQWKVHQPQILTWRDPELDQCFPIDQFNFTCQEI